MSDGTSYNIIVKPYFSYAGSGVPVGGHAKVASQTEDLIAHASYIYLIRAYINSYNAINARTIGRGAQPTCAARLLLVFATRTMEPAGLCVFAVGRAEVKCGIYS